MTSDSEECSEEELLDNEWPDDYFDEAVKEVEKREWRPKMPPPTSKANSYNEQDPLPITPPVGHEKVRAESEGQSTTEYISQATFSDLPQHVLRKIVVPLGLAERCRLMVTSRALKEAVENSKWTNLGNGELIVSAVEKPSGLIVKVSFGGILIVKSNEKNWEEIFTKLHRTFEKLHLNDLRLNNISLDDPLLQPVNDFLDSGITFDRLSFMRSKEGPISDRQVPSTLYLSLMEEYELIKRAKRDIFFHIQMGALTEEQILSFTRPVTLNILNDDERSYWTGKKEEMRVSVDLFVELVRRGHSLIKFGIESITVEALAEIIETVSSSPAPQMCLFRFPYAIAQNYVDALDAQLMFGPEQRCSNYTSYLHLGAKIMLDHMPIPPIRHLFARHGGGVLPANGAPPPVARPIHFHPAVVGVVSQGHPAGPATRLSPW